MQPEWANRYRSRFSDFRLPKEEKARMELAEEIGSDGRDLLEKVYASTTHGWLREIPAREILRSIWLQQYHASEQGTPWRKEQELAPSALLLEVTTTAATTPDGEVMEDLHELLAEKKVLPSGQKKHNLQAFLTATAMNVLRACHWVQEEKHGTPPSSCFAKLITSIKHVPVA